MLELLLGDFVLCLSICIDFGPLLELFIRHLFILPLGILIKTFVQLVQLREGFVGSSFIDFLLVVAVIEELWAQALSKFFQRLDIRLLVFLQLYLILLSYLLDLLLVNLLDFEVLVVLQQF